VQLRAKGLSDLHLLTLANDFTDACRTAHAISIINDRVDIALLSGADGVHLGQTEIPVSCVRQLARRPLIVGVSTHNTDELRAAIDAECDYAGIGPAFASPTKPGLTVAGIDYIHRAVSELEKAGIFHVAIGGINSDNLRQLLDVGVKAIAVSDTITSAPHPSERCKTLKQNLLNG
jgi:thiamine-phosphate pyrophosphorylase